MTDAIKIAPGHTVTLHFSIKLTDGSVADSTKVNGKPGCVTLGDGTLSAGFEQQLYGLSVGDTAQFRLSPDDAFGAPNPQNIHLLPLTQFPESVPVQVDSIVEFELPNGVLYPGIIRRVDDQQVTVDFNHPLAGQTLDFEVDILAIQ